METPDFRWPDVRGRRTLVLGLGGGADIVTACALAGHLDPAGSVAYGNTKHQVEDDAEALSPHVFRVPQGGPGRWTSLERALPRGPLGCPLVVTLPRGEDAEGIPAEIAALGFELLVGVDTGGDALVRKGPRPRGRDQRMLDLLVRAGVPTWLVVAGLGADGQCDASRLGAALAEEERRGTLLGRFALDPLLPALRLHSEGLAQHRTPKVILAATERPDDPVVVPRGCRPSIPREWLVTGFAFTARGWT